jgi:quercetin dioxygenase-like cupin family protein
VSPLARIRPAAEDREITLYGVRFRHRVDGDESGGSLAVVEVEIPARTLVKPHEHSREDEYTIVLEGTIGVRLGDDTAALGAGGSLVKPRGIPHAIWNPADAPARIVEIVSPAGFERYFEEMAPVLQRKGDTTAFYGLAERYGVRIVDEWIPELEERYGVKL